MRLRVLSGGHDIPRDVITRRFHLGLRNLFTLYMPLADKWSIYNNLTTPSQLIADNEHIVDSSLFEKLNRQYGN